MEKVLALEGIFKSFAGVHALVNVWFDVRAGEVHALLGENGAGKSTLIKIMAGVHKPDTGVIMVGGKVVAFTSPREASQAGIATVYQEPLLFPDLNVAENIFIGHPNRGTVTNWRQLSLPAPLRRVLLSGHFALRLLFRSTSRRRSPDATNGAQAVTPHSP